MATQPKYVKEDEDEDEDLDFEMEAIVPIEQERDVFNVREVDEFIVELCQGHDVRVQTWFKTIYKSAVLKHFKHVREVKISEFQNVSDMLAKLAKLVSPKWVENIQKEMTQANLYLVEEDKAPAWLKEKVSAGQSVVAIDLNKLRLEYDLIRHVGDYLETQITEGSGRLMHTFEDAVAKTKKWDVQLREQKALTEDPLGITTLASFDGFDFVLIHSEHSLKREGSVMHHCVAGQAYIDRMKLGVNAYVSMRKGNESILTIEISKAPEIAVKRVRRTSFVSLELEKPDIGVTITRTDADKRLQFSLSRSFVFSTINQIKGIQNRNMTKLEYLAVKKFADEFKLDMSSSIGVDRQNPVRSWSQRINEEGEENSPVLQSWEEPQPEIDNGEAEDMAREYDLADEEENEPIMRKKRGYRRSL